MRILVVEDEPALRQELKTRLVAAGFGVDLAGDGEEGLFAGLNYSLNAAIVDIGLPFFVWPRAHPSLAAARSHVSHSGAHRAHRLAQPG